jgi:hypothetical protein
MTSDGCNRLDIWGARNQTSVWMTRALQFLQAQTVLLAGNVLTIYNPSWW